MVAVNLTQLLSTLITANHILDYHQVVDGLGHISVRNPNNNATFFMTGGPPPALVQDLSDLNEYYISDGSVVSPSPDEPPQSPYSERFIHQGILKRYPSQTSVVHSHNLDVIPFGIGEVSFKPTYHMAGFVGETVPVFDIADYYLPNDTQNMLISSVRLGDALADTFSTPAHNITKTNTEPDYTLVLQRGHGFATVGTSVEESVYRAIYTTYNAATQASALEVENAAGKGADMLKYLTEREAADCVAMNRGSYGKAWPLWQAQVEANALYKNDLM